MKEYDLDAYSRKWRQTFGFIKIGKAPELIQTFFHEFFAVNDRRGVGTTVTHSAGPDKNLDKYSFDSCNGDYIMAELQYVPVESGMYVHRNGVALLTRRHVRGFQVGLSTNNYTLACFAEGGKDLSASEHRFGKVDLLRHAPTRQFDGRGFGVLSQRLWWKNDKLFHLNQGIGYIKGATVTVDNKAMIPHIKPFLGESCRITC